MVRVDGEIVINRPVEEVFDFVADEGNEPRYNARMRRAEKISEGPIGLGTRYRAELVSAGRPVPMVIKFTAYERPRRLASTTHMSSMGIQYTLTFEPDPGGTRMRWSGDIEPSGILKLMNPLVAWMGRRQELRIWTGLKGLLEERGTPVSWCDWGEASKKGSKDGLRGSAGRSVRTLQAQHQPLSELHQSRRSGPTPPMLPNLRMPTVGRSWSCCTIAVAADLAVLAWQTDDRAVDQRYCWRWGVRIVASWVHHHSTITQPSPSRTYHPAITQPSFPTEASAPAWSARLGSTVTATAPFEADAGEVIWSFPFSWSPVMACRQTHRHRAERRPDPNCPGRAAGPRGSGVPAAVGGFVPLPASQEVPGRSG